MALNTTPTDPSADSYVTLAEADAYLQDRTDVSDWTALTDSQKEAVLKLATKHINSMRFFNKPLIDYPTYYRDKQALKFPTKKEDHVTGAVDSAGNTTLVDSGLANKINMPDDYYNDGAVIITDGTGKGQTRKISDFVSSSGTITVSSAWTINPDSTSSYLVIVKIPQEVRDATVEQALYIVKGGGERAKLQAEGVEEYKIGDLMERFNSGVSGGDAVPISLEAKGLLKGFISKIGKLL